MDALLTQVLQCEPLVNYIQDLQLRTGALNLVQSKWEDILDHSEIYKKHVDKIVTFSKGKAVAKDNALISHISHPDNQYNIIVFGEFSLSQNENSEFSIVARQCPALQKIGLSMAETPLKKLHDSGRFFVKVCEPLLCNLCLESHKIHNVPMVKKNWCVSSLRIFNGKQISFQFTLPMQQMMLNTKNFLAIFHMKIVTRTSFNDAYKIGGQIYEMIIFQHSAIRPLIPLNFLMDLPKIEYPPDNQDVQCEGSPQEH